MGWLYLAAVSCLLSASCHGAAVSGEDAVGVSMCCPEGRVLKIVENPARRLGGWGKNRRGDEYIPKCVRSRRAPKDTLDGSPIAVTDVEGSGAEKLVVVKKTGVMLPSCSLGLKYQMVSLKTSDSNDEGSGSGDGESVPDSSKRVRLGDYSCGRSKCNKGNVYVDDKPVCDDDWDDTDAEVVCRELGFTSGGYATQESYFGKVDLEKQSGFDSVRCSGRESSLVDCRHEAFDDCGDSEGAGVVCYQDDEEMDDVSDYDYRESPKSSVAVHLTSAGQLPLPESTPKDGLPATTYKAGEFCMAGVFEGDDNPRVAGVFGGEGMKEGEAIAVMCEPCKSEVLCSTILLDFFGSFPGNEIEGDERSFGANNVILVGDKDADGKVNFDEFKAGVEDYVRKVFDFLDSDGDGSLDEGVSLKSLSAKFLLQVLNEAFLFFDVNQDDIMSPEDFPPRTFRDRNDDGKISLREVFGVSLINLPAPLYRLYTTLDKDKNEKISIEEATNFIKGVLHVIDQNEDCSIDIDEFIAALDESKLPKEFQLAVKLLGDYYFELGDFILRQFVAAADADGDKKTTLSEMIGLKDPAVLFSILSVAENMGMPNSGTGLFLLQGDGGRGNSYHREQRQAVIEMWLNVLYDFVDNRKLQSAPADFCGLE